MIFGNSLQNLYIKVSPAMLTIKPGQTLNFQSSSFEIYTKEPYILIKPDKNLKFIELNK